MTGYTVHTGSSEQFVDGWDRIFSGKKTAKKKSTTKSAKKTKKKTPAKKKPGKRKNA